MPAEIIAGDCLDVLRGMADASVDAVVTDPPYELGFMGKRWDSTGIAYSVELWRECLRVLKPGGHLVAFGGTRTAHRMTCAIEDAGFEVRDSIAWMYGQGFPKSLDVSKALDKAAGAEREVVGSKLGQPGYSLAPDRGRGVACVAHGDSESECSITAPATPAARQWSGWGTALKPAHEPVTVARKPLAGTVAANVVAHGTGAINVDACRIGVEGGGTDCPHWPAECPGHGNAGRSTAGETRHGKPPPGWPNAPVGRWPANVVLDEHAAAELDEQSGERRSAGDYPSDATARNGATSLRPTQGALYADSGGASRFFYCAKPSVRERDAGLEGFAVGAVKGTMSVANGTGERRDGAPTSQRANVHPTVKPVALMRWLVRLVTPPGGLILDPFAGSGSTLVAAVAEGFSAIGIERELAYVEIARARVAKALADRDGALFAGRAAE